MIRAVRRRLRPKTAPALPVAPPDPGPAVDLDEGSDAYRVVHIAVSAAMSRMLADAEAGDRASSVADLAGRSVTEGVLHLLELGLLDIGVRRVGPGPLPPEAAKPALPARGWFGDWPRVAVDLTEGGDAWRIVRLAVTAAEVWVLADAQADASLTAAVIQREAVTVALAHLLELGLVDIDVQRLRAAPSMPMRRWDALPVG
ncbi:hypothetical protein [Kitasatospora sp. NPDC088783]|uniref:hypothetical protein n=1 Tax=Kitasatospora sp. NPDC088783 TaxID=3364077 RepID=UPI0038107C60